MMKHVIKTQSFEVFMNKAEDSFNLHQQMRDFFFQILLPMLEKTFDQLAPADTIIRLDKVEIELGKMNLRDLGSTNVMSHFSDIIHRHFQQIILSPIEKQSQTPVHYSVVQQWLYYMKNGYLPWNTTSSDKDWHLKVLEGLATDYNSIEEFRSLILTDTYALRRIVLLHTPEYLLHLIEVLVAVKQEQLLKIIGAINLSFEKGDKSIRSKKTITERIRRVWLSVFRIAASEKREMKTEEIIAGAVLKELDTVEVELLNKHAAGYEQLIPFIPFIKERLERQNSKSNETKDQDKEFNPLKKQVSKIPDESIFINHAGLVLLHPFLNIFFKYLKVINGKQFISFDEQQKAVVLLYFLATGKDEFQEHELVIEKLLCGCPLEFPIDPQIILSAEELNECDLLLKEVVAQWQILKNTSPDGLRINFFQRQGKLFTRNNEPCLLVESNVLDVLLDHLPWSISVIKLPWMPQPLKVEWR
jgi:hypothetical protein